MTDEISVIVSQIVLHSEEESPVVKITKEETDEYILKFGTYLSLLENKITNPTNYFLSIIKNKEIESQFLEMIGVNTLLEGLKILLNRYPNLLKSKIVKEMATKIIKSRNNVKR